MKKSLKITLIAAAAAVIIAAGSITAVTVSRNSPEYTLSLAERYLDELNYEQAIIEFEKYLEIEPMDADAWLKLAEAYEKSGNIEAALGTIKEALYIIGENEALLEKMSELNEILFPVVTTTEVIMTEPPEISEIIVTTTIPEVVINPDEPDEPLAIEAMILNHIKYGSELNTDVLQYITYLGIHGTDLVCVQCGDKEGTRDTIAWSGGSGNEFEYMGTVYPEAMYSDFDFLKNCTNLRELSITRNAVMDLSFLNNLPELERLYLFSNEITDIYPISGLSKLTHLDLTFNFITDISPLSEVSSLENLGLCGNFNLSDISAISELKELTWLDINANQVTDISPLSGATSLRCVFANSNQIVDVSSLSTLKNLHSIYLANNPINYESVEILQQELPSCEIFY